MAMFANIRILEQDSVEATGQRTLLRQRSILVLLFAYQHLTRCFDTLFTYSRDL